MTRLVGLYLITPGTPMAPADLAAIVDRAIRGGARLVQYRDKGADTATRDAKAEALLALCRSHGVPLIINDDLGLASRIGADGVHLGLNDAEPRLARARLGRGALIGVSCYADPVRARDAAAAGADYLAFGSFFRSATKPDAVQADPALLRAARETLGRPLVAIGGITPDNGGPLIAAGADMLAVVSGVFDAPDCEAAARAYTRLFPTEDY